MGLVPRPPVGQGARWLCLHWPCLTICPRSYARPLKSHCLIVSSQCECYNKKCIYNSLFSATIVGIVVGRDIALIAGVAIYRYRELPPSERTLRGYFHITDRPTHEITPNLLSKINTGVQVLSFTLRLNAHESSVCFRKLGLFFTFVQLSWIGFGLMSVAYGVPALGSGVVEGFGYCTLATTIASGLSYALKRGMTTRVAPNATTTTAVATEAVAPVAKAVPSPSVSNKVDVR